MAEQQVGPGARADGSVGRGGSSSAPAPIRVASGALAAQGLLLAALVVATLLWERLLVETWAANDPAASLVVADGGLGALADSPVVVPAFVPVAVVTFLTLVPLGAVLTAMLRHGAAWVRPWLTVLALVGLVFSALALRTGPPLGFGVLTVLAGASCVVLVAGLWHPAAGRWLRPVTP